jgi:two-component system nitrogen regulation sensor histidine kinase GlnL
VDLSSSLDRNYCLSVAPETAVDGTTILNPEAVVSGTLAHMEVLSFHTDSDLCIRSWPKEIAAFTGRAEPQIIGSKYYEIFPRIYFDNKDAVAEAISTGQTISFPEYAFRCLYGGIKADITIRPLRDSAVSEVSAEVIIHPHSTCAVAQKLHQSQKLIDIGKIASTLAHGVRNPLNAIKGAVVYLREKYDREEPLVEFTKIMGEEISRLEDFISRFLSSSVSVTEAQATDINALLKKIEVFTSLQIYARNIHSIFEFGNIPPISINSFHLEQAVLNVINNAIDAMDAGGQLKIRSFTESHAGRSCVVIAISDTGPGITDKTLDELTSAQKENGRGFGLFITDEILKHYGGRLEMDSKKNAGTTIKLIIPTVGM